MDQATVDLKPARDPSASSLALNARERDGALAPRAVSFRDPQEVLAHPALDISDKRAILAGWASDACAVENLPNWRRLPETGALVALDDILDALQALDRGALH
ncbi:hypothetical protein [Microvirga makkahensis]|uniref:Uncharacterized protein n=1 Tax=Microvirga makkahensis TaxID=1128670 RepID=A0A7X3MNY0_9HYPH|nr:hypothetical protein [Microvirga makkahensis]MXQ10493.1 hypothetical protein [Microvirga makkahensis]